MNPTEERLILDEVESAAREYRNDDTEYNRGFLRGLQEAASVLNIDPSKVVEAVRAWQRGGGTMTENTAKLLGEIADLKEYQHRVGKALARIDGWHKIAGPITQGALETVLRIFKEEGVNG